MPRHYILCPDFGQLWTFCQGESLRQKILVLEQDGGGEGGIRTHGTLAGSTVFETAPFDHSGTSPRFLGGGGDLDGPGLKRKGLRAKNLQNFHPQPESR